MNLDCLTPCCWNWETAAPEGGGKPDWSRSVYLKTTPGPEDKVIEIKEQTFLNKDLLLFNTAPGNAWSRASVEKMIVPPGRYVADSRDKDKLHYVTQIDSKSFTSRNFSGDPIEDQGSYWGEEQSVVAGKAAAAVGTVFMIPAYCVVTAVINLIRIPLNIVDRSMKIYEDVKETYKNEGACKALVLLVGRSVIDITTTIAEGICSIVRIPFFAIAVAVALVYTVISPYNGRKLVSDIEKAWHYPCTDKDDISHKENTKWETFSEFLNLLNTKVHFLFFCFQEKESYSKQPNYIKLQEAP